VAYTEFYIDGANGSASNINGGSSSGAALFSKTNGNWNSTTKVFTVGAGDTLTSDMVGHFACVCNDGTTTGAYFARVTAIDNSAKTVTLSSTATIGTAPTTSTTGRTIKVGGCWAGMSGSTLFPFTLSSSAANLTDASNNAPRFNFKGTYNNSTSSGITSSFGGTSNKNGPFIEGFSSFPGDGGVSIFNYTGASNVATVNIAAQGQYSFSGIEFKNQSTSATTSTCFGMYFQTSASSAKFHRCKFTNTVAQGMYFSVGSQVILTLCEFANCSNGVTSNGGGQLLASNAAHVQLLGCIFRNSSGNTGTIVIIDSEILLVSNCIFCDNGTPCIKVANGVNVLIDSSVFYSNSGGCILRDSASTSYSSQVTAARCIFDSNSYVVNLTALTNNRSPYLRDCGFYNNTAKYDSNSSSAVELDCFDFTDLPLVDAVNGDYRTRSTMGRNRVDGTIANSSKSLTTKRRLDIGIGPSNPFYRGQ